MHFKEIFFSELLQHIDSPVDLFGWIHSKREHGKLVFLDLRDHTGLVQVVGDKSLGEVSTEDVVHIHGVIKKRPERLINKNISTGSIEIQADVLEVLSDAKTPPFPLDSEGLDIDEELRLKYRYLDLRRLRMTQTLKLRSDYYNALRKELGKKDFIEVETPMLTTATKEGARDFLVPSRLQPGKFYALPQSPQQYKQLLMVAGVERYFQFARCIRDEDLRSDRGFEFTQLDLEMSFVNREDVMATVEDIVRNSVKAVGRKLQNEKFPVFSYEQVMKKFGSDKFDLRNEQEKKDGILAFAWVINFPFFKRVDKKDRAEIADGKSGWTFTHNPFSMPISQHLAWHLAGTHIDEITTTQYDLVCNGYEAGGGSIRAHKSEILEATYKMMGYTPEETRASIGHMLDAFSYGTPPHGGIALGMDRQIMIMAHQNSLKEAIAFPMSSGGKTAVMDAPSEPTPEQLLELGLSSHVQKK